MRCLTIGEFRTLLQQLYNITEEQARNWITEFAIFNQLHNGASVVCEVEKSEFIEYEEWLKETAPPNQDFCDANVETILCDACNRGMFPAGTCVFRYSW